MFKNAFVSSLITGFIFLFTFGATIAFGENPSVAPPGGLVHPTFSGVTTPVIYSPEGEILAIATTYGISITNAMGGSDYNMLQVNPGGVIISSDGESGVAITADGADVKLKGDATVVEGFLEFLAFNGKNNPQIQVFGAGDALSIHSDSAIQLSAPQVSLTDSLTVNVGDGSDEMIYFGEAFHLIKNIYANDSASFNLRTGSNGLGKINFGDSGDPDRGYIGYHQGTDKMSFRTHGDAVDMVIDSGWVGIGVDQPTAALDVVGDVKFTGDIVPGGATVSCFDGQILVRSGYKEWECADMPSFEQGTYTPETSGIISVEPAGRVYNQQTPACDDFPDSVVISCSVLPHYWLTIPPKWKPSTQGRFSIGKLYANPVTRRCEFQVYNEATSVKGIEVVATCFNP